MYWISGQDKGELITQYPQCAFSYVFYVCKTYTLFSMETDKNGYVNFARFVCTPQFPYILFANVRIKQNRVIRWQKGRVSVAKRTCFGCSLGQQSRFNCSTQRHPMAKRKGVGCGLPPRLSAFPHVY